MTHPYIANGEAWSMSLRDLMGYPLYEPSCNSVAWSAGPLCDVVQALQVTQIAHDMGRDIVHVAFASIVPGEPSAVSLAIRQDSAVEWLSNCRLYAATEFERIELLGGGRRWHIGPRFVLTSHKMPPQNRRARGEQIAMRRWRKMAATINVNASGSKFVGPGQTFADAVPTADLQFED